MAARRATARTIHMFCSYWGFALMSLHFGFYGNMFLGISKKLPKKQSVLRTAALRVLTAGVAGYGIYINLGYCIPLQGQKQSSRISYVCFCCIVKSSLKEYADPFK